MSDKVVVPDKEQLLTMLKDEFNRWEELLKQLEEQITAPLVPSNWSIKDVVAHLRAWQQVSIARMEAAAHNSAPEYPEWLAGLHPESEENRQKYNERIYEAYRDQSWSSVHQVWKEGFLRFLELAEALSEKDLFEMNKYTWLEGYSLSAVLEGSYEHHEEHLEALLEWRREQRNSKNVT